MRDVWCSNCRQLIQPIRKPGPLAYLLALVIFAGVAYTSWGAPDYLMRMLIGAGVALLLGGLLGALTLIRTCPICGTQSLETPPNTE